MGSRGTYHIFWLFGTQRDCARAIVFNLILDEAHCVGWLQATESRITEPSRSGL